MRELDYGTKGYLMKQCCHLMVLLSLGLLVPVTQALTVDLNRDWRFQKGTIEHAEQIGYDDSQWRQLSVPHDWSIEDLSPGCGPLDPNAVGSCNTGYFVGGTAWYRKHFALDEKHRGQRVYVYFDGVYMNADVWINGHHLGNHPYGYTAFRYELTDHLRWDQDNVLVVEVKNEGVNSRWYSGSGLYRPVHLEILSPVHIDPWGPAVTTTDISDDSACVRVRTQLIHSSEQGSSIRLNTRILDVQGQVVAEDQSVPYTSLQFDQILTVTRPRLWLPDSPTLYRLSQRVFIQDQVVDERVTFFGIRTLHCDAQEGFTLNGKPMLLQGLCMHHDNYMLGAAAYPRAEQRRVEIVKAAGYNAIRCAHNPPSTAFLEACDRLGLLVIDEAFDQWTKKKKRQDYHNYFRDWWQRDLAGMVLRDRNHPSVVMWSLGNEIPEQRSSRGAEIAGRMAAFIKSLDDSRLVTIGANMAGEVGDPLFAHLDVAGYNYPPKLENFETDRQRVPDRVMYTSESFVTDAFTTWMDVESQPYNIGDFVWTGYDYLGEASIGWFGYRPGWKGTGPFAWHLAYCGEIDALGYKRPAAYYRDVLWKTGKHPISAFVKSPKPSLPDDEPNNILYWVHPDFQSHWTWPGYEGKTLEVVVYSVYEQVELLLDGRSLGQQAVSRDTQYTATFQVPYAPGQLKAVGYAQGTAQESWLLQTTGEPARLQLTADRQQIKADGQDLAYVTIDVVDEKGIRVPQAESLVHLDIHGPATLAGVGNGRPYGNESFQQPQRTAFQGRCMVVLKSTDQAGIVTLKATGEGLPEAKILIECQ